MKNTELSEWPIAYMQRAGIIIDSNPITEWPIDEDSLPKSGFS